MTDELGAAGTGEAPLETAEAEPVGFGATLARARERAGLSRQDIAARLRLSVHQVQAIEEEALGALPVAAYVRGFIRSYARIVNLNAEALLADFNALAAPAGLAADSMRSPERSLATDGRSSRHVVVAVGVLVLVALGAIGWYASTPRSVRVAASESVRGVAEPVTVVAANSPSEPAVPASASAGSSDGASAREVPPAEEPRLGDVASPRDVNSSLVLASAAAPSAVLGLAIVGPCWVEVTSSGRVIHSQLHAAGEELKLEGPLPMTVVLGDGSSARVWVRGKPLELDSVTRGNVARFTVN